MGKVKRKVSIIIPNYNGKEHLKRLLASIAEQTFDDYEVIIIDDFSQDRSVLDYVKTFIKGHENMRLVENTENMGFVKTCNKGFGLADGDYVCILTNDTEVKGNFVEKNVEIMNADSSIGVLSCIIVDQHGNNWFSGGSFKGGFPVNLKDDFEGIRTVDFAAGTAPFYRREVLNKVGLLNEDFFMYHEDIDFCLRVRNKTDYKVCTFSQKLVRHYPNISEPGAGWAKLRRILYYGHRNHILILRKYCPRYLPKVLLSHSREIANFLAVSILKPSPKMFLIALSVARGVLAGLVKRQSKQLQAS